jgi:hypothetical protein
MEALNPAARVRIFLLVCAILLAGYSWLLLRNNTFCVGGSDSSGYVNAARRVVAGRLVDRPRTLDRLGPSDPFSPLFIPRSKSRSSPNTRRAAGRRSAACAKSPCLSSLPDFHFL